MPSSLTKEVKSTQASSVIDKRLKLNASNSKLKLEISNSIEEIEFGLAISIEQEKSRELENSIKA